MKYMFYIGSLFRGIIYVKKTLMIPNNVSGEEKQLSAQTIRASHYIKVIISLLTCYYTITRTFCCWYRGLHNVFHSYLLWRNIVHHPLLVFVMRFEVPYFILVFACPNFDFFFNTDQSYRHFIYILSPQQ